MSDPKDFSGNIARRKIVDMIFAVLGAVLITLALGVLAALVIDLFRDGFGRLRPDFFLSFPSRHPQEAGIKSAIVGTCLVMMVTAATALPLGVAAGIYLEEYGKKNLITTIIEINIANLAGVPSIIWGLMALGVLVYWLGMDRSIATAGLTLGLLVLPIVIVATRESIRAIPQTIREASYACGATRLQTVWYHILPYSLGGVLTGSIIALSRAIGETAPLITIGALTFIAFLPPAPFSERAWLTTTTSQVAIPAAEIAQPLSADADLSPRPRDGDITLSIRARTDDPAAESTVPVTAGTVTLTSLAAALDAVDGVAAVVTPDGHLRLDAEGESQFLVVKDTTGIVSALGLEEGGGRHGPFDWLGSGYTVLPIQMFNWVSRPDRRFQENAAAAGIVLLTITLSMNAIAIFLRYRLRRKIQW